MKKIQKIWNEIPSGIYEVKDFALVMGTVFLIMGLSQQGIKLALQWDNLLLIGLAFLAIGILKPDLLTQLQKAWMFFGVCLSFITTSVILLLIYVLVFFPTGILLKMILKKKLLEEIDPSLSSYWSQRSKALRKPVYYQKQF